MGIPTLHIRLLGDFNLQRGDEPVTSVSTARLQSLLAYLALHQPAQLSRRHLAFTLWPDKTEAQAQNNLRQLIHLLRQALPESGQYFFTNASTLGWQPGAKLQLDVVEFEAAWDAALAAGQAGDLAALRSHLETSLRLYRGELLPSCYDDWIIAEREKLHEKYTQALKWIVELLESQHEYGQAIRYAKQLLHDDNLNEKHYRLLMLLYALNNERANALHLYHQCADTLQRELGEEPEPATRAIYHRLLRQQELDSSPPSAAHIATMASTPPLVGREAEWKRFVAAWQGAAARGMCFVLLAGEAGIGKSRLAEEMLLWVARQGFSIAQTRSYAAEGRLAYGPIADWLRSEAVRPGLKNLSAVWQSEIARLLPELLVEASDLPPAEPLRENWQRQSFYQALTQAILAMPQPGLLFIDDLQWCDPETLEWLHYFMRSQPGMRVLVAGTVRVEELAENQALQSMLSALRQADTLIELHLNPLDAAETARLAAHITGDELETPVALQLFVESEGNPLFVLETIRSGYLRQAFDPRPASHSRQETIPVPGEGTSLPPKVLAVLQARLDALTPPTRQLASLAATVGRAFSFDVLAQASDSAEEELLLWLDELWQRRIVRVLDETTYDFSHDKLREVAYNQASLPHRSVLHRRVARALETLYASDIDTVSGQIAVHFDKAGLPEPAIHYYHQGALVERRINANRQAIKLIKRALALLESLPPGHERDACELDLLASLVVCRIDTLGHGAAEVIQICDRALALCQKLGRPPDPPILRTVAIYHVARAEFRRALEYSRQLVHLAESQEDRPLLVEANYSMGVTSFWMGAFQASRDYLESAVALYDPQDAHLHISRYSQNPKAICQIRLAFTVWCLGYPGQAAEAGRLALNEAQEISHPWSLAYVSYWDAIVAIHNREFDLAAERLAALTSLCQDYQIQHFIPLCAILQDWLQADQGEIEARSERIRERLEQFQAEGTEFQRPFFLSLLAELLGRQGKIMQGLALLREALELVRKSEEHWCEAEILRRQGELLWKQADLPGAEAALQQSLLVARRQTAKMLELRAALALAQVWLESGKAAQAVELILPVYHWFGEGEDTPDLHDARQMLAEIEANSGK